MLITGLMLDLSDFGFWTLYFEFRTLDYGLEVLDLSSKVLKIDSAYCPRIVTLGFFSDFQGLSYCNIYFCHIIISARRILVNCISLLTRFTLRIL